MEGLVRCWQVGHWRKQEALEEIELRRCEMADSWKGQGKLPQDAVTDNALLKRKYETEELEGKFPLMYTSTPDGGLEIEDGTSSRGIVTAEIAGGVATGNFS